MESMPREQIIHSLQELFQSCMEKYDLDEIGIFEEEGQDDIYYMGYTVNKDGQTYHIHSTFRKDGNNSLIPLNQLWSIETDEPNGEDLTGYPDVESAFREI